MTEVLETVQSPCPDPSKHTRRALWRFGIDRLGEAGLIVMCLLLFWNWFGVHHHMIPVKHEVGDYGVVELPDLITPQTKIVEFSAVRLPSSVIQVPYLLTASVSETIHVTVRYEQPDGTAGTWDSTYNIGCDTRGACQPLRTLVGVLLYGSDGSGGVIDRHFVHFLTSQRYLPQPSSQPEDAVPAPRPPQPVPNVPQQRPFQSLPPGTTIA